MSGFYPPAPPGRCSPSDPAARCAERRDAMAAGTFLYDHTRQGWVSTDTPLRRPTMRARWLAIKHGAPDTDGEPFLWQLCPFCFHELPDLTPPAQADGASYGDGPE